MFEMTGDECTDTTSPAIAMVAVVTTLAILAPQGRMCDHCRKQQNHFQNVCNSKAAGLPPVPVLTKNGDKPRKKF